MYGVTLFLLSIKNSIAHVSSKPVNANALVTITALLGLWCRRRVPQTGMIFYPSLRCVLLAPESLMCISLQTLVSYHAAHSVKFITYGTAGVKTSEHVNLYISLYTKNFLYHHFIPILTKYLPNCFRISMPMRCLIQCLREDISVGGGCLRQGYFAYSCLRCVLRVTVPIWQGAILHNLRNHLIKWLVHACSISYQLYIGYRYYLYTLFISIYYIYTSCIFLYIHRYTVVSEHVNYFILYSTLVLTLSNHPNMMRTF